MFRNKEKIRRIILNAKRITVEKVNSNIIINDDDANESLRDCEEKPSRNNKLMKLSEEMSTLRTRDSIEKTFDELLILVRSSIVETNNVETTTKMKMIKDLIIKSSCKISEELENLYAEYVRNNEMDFLENRIENILDMIELTKQITNIANHLYPKEVKSLIVYLNLTLSQEDLLTTVLEEIWKFTRHLINNNNNNNNLKFIIPIGKKLTSYGKYLQTTNIVDAKRTAFEEIFMKKIEQIEKKIQRLIDEKYEEKIYGSTKWRELTKVISNLRQLSETLEKLSNSHNVTSFFYFLRANDSNVYFPMFKKVHGDIIRRMCEIVNVQICRLHSLYYKTESVDDRNQLAIYSSVMIEKLINIVSKINDINIGESPELVIKFNHDHINIEKRLRDMIVNRIFVPRNYMVPHDIYNIREVAKILRACRVRLENIVAQREASSITNNDCFSSSSSSSSSSPESSDDDSPKSSTKEIEQRAVEIEQRVEEIEQRVEEEEIQQQQQQVEEKDKKERVVEGEVQKEEEEEEYRENIIEDNDMSRSSSFSSTSSRSCIFFSFSSKEYSEDKDNDDNDADDDESSWRSISNSSVVIENIDETLKDNDSSLTSFEGKSGGQNETSKTSNSSYDKGRIEDEIIDDNRDKSDDNISEMIIDGKIDLTTDGQIGEMSSTFYSSSGNSLSSCIHNIDEKIVDCMDDNIENSSFSSHDDIQSFVPNSNSIDILWDDVIINDDNNKILKMLFCGEQNSCLLSHKLVDLDANNFGKLYSAGKLKYSHIFPTICRHCLKSKFGLYEDCVDNEAFSNCIVNKNNDVDQKTFLKGFKAIPSLVDHTEKVFEPMTIILPSGKLLLEMLMTDPKILYNSNKIIPTYKTKTRGQIFFLNPYIYGYFKHIHDIITNPSNNQRDLTSVTCITNYQLSPMQLLQASGEIDALVMSQLIEPGGKFSSYVKTGKSVFIEKDKVLKIKILLNENNTVSNDDDILILIENKINNNITSNPSKIKIQNLNANLSTYTYSTRMAIKNSKEKLEKYFSSYCDSSAVELFVSSFCFPSVITLRPNSDEIYQQYRPNCKYLPGIGLISLTSICNGDLLIIERSISIDMFANTNSQRLIYDEERQYPTKKRRKIKHSVEILPFKKVCLYNRL